MFNQLKKSGGLLSNVSSQNDRRQQYLLKVRRLQQHQKFHQQKQAKLQQQKQAKLQQQKQAKLQQQKQAKLQQLQKQKLQKQKLLDVTVFEKIVIVANKVGQKLGIANNIKKQIKQIIKPMDVEIMTKFPILNKDNHLYIFLYFYNIFDISKYPKHYMVWQIEQLSSKDQKSFILTPNKINVFNNAINIFEISMKNYNNKYYSNITRKKILYNPIPFYNEKNNILFDKKNIDCVFFGAINNRRMAINSYLKKELYKHGITFKILYGVFGKQLTNILEKTKYVINLHYYDKPCLEGARINIAIENNCLTISEDVFEDEYTKYLYKDYTIYNPCIKEDLRNINIFINSIIHNLKPAIYKKNISNFNNNKEKLSIKFENLLKKNLSSCIKIPSPQFLMSQQYFIINNNLEGGSHKWQKDVEEYISLFRIYNYNMFYQILQNHNNPENIVVLINSFIKTDFTIDNILFLYYKYKFKIILPIHEWYWFNKENSYTKNYHSIYLDKNFFLPGKSKQLFDICTKIICPTKFVYNIIYKHYPSDKIKHIDWIDYDFSNTSNNYKIKKNTQINIGVFVYLNECKGKEQITFLCDKYKNIPNINILIVGINIEKHKDNYHSFINLIKKYNIHGLLYLNKWGETWCYSLSKGLKSGLPIFYNNIGSFKERIPKNIDKYIINNNNESKYYNYDILERNFSKFIKYIQNNDIFINDSNRDIKDKKLINIISNSNN